MAVVMDEFGRGEFLQLCQALKIELDSELLDLAGDLLDRCGDDVRRRYIGTSISKVMRLTAIVDISTYFAVIAVMLPCSASLSGGDSVLTSDHETH